MAIFGNADRNLPLLTQLYQVELPAGAEKDLTLLLGSELERWMEFVTDERLVGEVLDEDIRILHVGFVAEIHSVAVALMNGIMKDNRVGANVLQRFQNLLAEENQYARRYLLTLRFVPYELSTNPEIAEMWEGANETFDLRMAAIDAAMDTKARMEARKEATFAVPYYLESGGLGSIPIELLPTDTEVDLSRVFVYPHKVVELIHRLLQDLVLLLTWEIHITRCIECTNIFVKERASNVYCSHRCSNRVASRKRYSKTKE